MKEYIVLTIINNTLVFNFRTIAEEEKSFINSNGFYKDSLFYTLKYYKKNVKSIINTINKSFSNELNTIKVLRLVTFKYPNDLIKGLNISNLVLDFSSTIDMKDYRMFLESKSLKNIYCYYMPNQIEEEFKKRGVNVFKSTLKKISPSFFSQQDAFENDTLYYKKVVNINEEYPLLIEDLKEFLKINYNLKAIHLYTYSKYLIESIVDLVKNDESRNVVIFLHQGYDKGDFILSNFDWLKELSNKCKQDYTCEFRIIYANSFLRNHLFKQLTFNNLKLISILCIYVCIVSLIIVKSYEYIEQVSTNQLKHEIINSSNNTSSDTVDDEEDDDYGYLDDLPDEGREEIEQISKEDKKNKYSFSNSIKALKKINKEVKGYLIVNNTEISYPVVQHSDNNYYLNHDIYKRKTYVGWVFADYRNNMKSFDDNTIIYGHNMPNGSMFGSLRKVLLSSWRKKEENLIISLDTESGSYKFRIFSIYKVNYTTDYLKIFFSTKDDKKDFIKMIKNRSTYKNKVSVGVNDKILTLSTCAGSNNKRLVVHAVLIKDEKEE